ncbi:MAG: M64 family metallopeptidase [Polyangiaceae bacterium]
MGNVRKSPWLALFVGLLVLIGCGSDRGDAVRDPGTNTPSAREPDRVVATVLLAQDQLTLVGLRPAGDELPKSEPVAPLLSWQFSDATGKVLASGSVTAPLVVLAEFDENGKPAPETTVAGAATFEIEIPNVGGTFELFDPVTGGTQQQDWGGLGKKLKLFIEKLKGLFQFKGSGSGGTGAGGASSGGGTTAGGAGGTSAGGTSAGGASAGGTSAGGTGAGGSTGVPSGVESGPIVQMVKPSTSCVGMTLLVVAEGYTKAEESKFQADAEQIVGAISTHSGYKEIWKDVAVYRKFYVSKESGISDPAAKVKRDTAFHVEHDATVHRSIYSAADVPAATKADLAAAKAETKADAVLYIANISEWAGAAQPWNREGYVAAHPQAGLIMSHELAHALFDLADEYDVGTCNPENSFKGPNISVGLTALPWTSSLTPGVALPTTGGDANTVGAYEGALYCKTGVYRPQANCKMRAAETGFCKVCLAQIQSRIQVRTAACNAGSCDHSECKAGGALAKECSACASTVCAAKPECCDKNKGWTDECVKLAIATPGPCRAICYDGNSSCGHGECSEGAALSQSCSTCADSVCKKDPYCCSGKWDPICSYEAEKDPYCSCKTTP